MKSGASMRKILRPLPSSARPGGVLKRAVRGFLFIEHTAPPSIR